MNLLSRLLTSLSASKEREYYVNQTNQTVKWPRNNKQQFDSPIPPNTNRTVVCCFPNMTSTSPTQIWWNLNQGAAGVRGTQPARPAWNLPRDGYAHLRTIWRPIQLGNGWKWPIKIRVMKCSYLIFSDICWHWLSSQCQLYQRRTPSPLKL